MNIQLRPGSGGSAGGNRVSRPEAAVGPDLDTLSFGIETLRFTARRVSRSMRDTAQSRNGLPRARRELRTRPGLKDVFRLQPLRLTRQRSVIPHIPDSSRLVRDLPFGLAGERSPRIQRQPIPV